jgi:hypothetical protein
MFLGWEKTWRAACYAQLGNAAQFYWELNVGPLDCCLLSDVDVQHPISMP